MPRAKKSNVIENPPMPTELKETLTALAGLPTTTELVTGSLESALANAKAEITRIDERADFAINVISQSIRTRAAVEKGRVLLKIQSDWETNPQFEGCWSDFLETVGGRRNTYNWINAAKVVEDNNLLFGTDEMIMNIAPSALDRIQKLPAEAKLDVLEKIAEGEKVTEKEVKQVANKTETKISKTAELLLEARAKREAIANGEIEYSSAAATCNGKRDNEDQITKLTQQLADLQKQFEQEQLRAKEESKKAKKMEEELDKLKFDDALAREQRVKRVANTLTIQLPNIQGDIQKFWAERDYYPAEYQTAIDSLIGDLQKLIKK